jgi:hypoxanthine phosphoribosyltransferase
MDTVKFDLSHTNPMDWDEFQSIVNHVIDTLVRFQNDNDLTFDAVSPILRSGAIPATMIANKLQIIPSIPVQVKYNYDADSVDTIIAPQCPQNRHLEEIENILVVESNTYTGQSSRLVCKLLRETFPHAKIHYVCMTKVFGGPDITEDYDSYHYGRLTNEAFKDNAPDECREGITIYPWETAEFELEDINNDLQSSPASPTLRAK